MLEDLKAVKDFEGLDKYLATGFNLAETAIYKASKQLYLTHLKKILKSFGFTVAVGEERDWEDQNRD